MDDNKLTVEEISTSNLHCHCEEIKEEMGYWKAAHVMADPYTIDKGKF
jgi:hypothetical protein